jgi:ankyrin repeat protein
MRRTTRFCDTSLCKSIHPTTLTPLACYCDSDCECAVSNSLGLICLHQNGMTALLIASKLGDITMVDFLLTKGANIESQANVRYAVSLQYPVRQNKQAVEDCIARATYDVTD